MNIITIEEVAGKTQIKVNGEFIGEIKGKLHKSKLPPTNSSYGSPSQRYENYHGSVWITVEAGKEIRCKKCGKDLNPTKLCGYHNQPICTDCNACSVCLYLKEEV